jgi:hypothetical protein
MAQIPASVREALHRLTTREVHRHAIDLTEAVVHLRPKQRRQTDDLAAVLGCSFPEWTTLYGTSYSATPTQPPVPLRRLL